MVPHLGARQYWGLPYNLVNEKASLVEFSLYDPDGYALTVSQWKG